MTADTPLSTLRAALVVMEKKTADATELPWEMEFARTWFVEGGGMFIAEFATGPEAGEHDASLVVAAVAVYRDVTEILKDAIASGVWGSAVYDLALGIVERETHMDGEPMNNETPTPPAPLAERQIIADRLRSIADDHDQQTVYMSSYDADFIREVAERIAPVSGLGTQPERTTK